MGYGIGERIKQRRLELGLTQLELAERMGYTSKAAICKVEKGDDNITTDRVSKFAKALGVTESFLMGWENQEIEEQYLLDAWREADEETRNMIIRILAFNKSRGDN